MEVKKPVEARWRRTEIVDELKITLFFTRRYLGNWESYRNESSTVLKRMIPRFQRSFIYRFALIIFEVTAIQIFVNFNRRIRSKF